MAKQGDLVEFKAGLFGIEIPNNYGIFIKRYRNKKTKNHIVELFTIKGKQETIPKNIENRDFGKSIQLIGDQLPQPKDMKKRLDEWIRELKINQEKISKTLASSGSLSERELWVKLQNQKEIKEEYSLEDLAYLWYEIPLEEISKNRINKLKEELQGCKTYGIGYFDLIKKNWKPISNEQRILVNQETSALGALRNKMFQLVEVVIEESETEETQLIKQPIKWSSLDFSPEESELFKKLQQIMSSFVINDSWPSIGLGNTHIFALDGFSLRNFLAYLAEDWVNEGKTSISDVFVKMLIQTKYWTDTDALLAISMRNVKLAPFFEWETDTRIEEVAARFKEPKDTPGAFDNRLDLQYLETYTIDPPTAKDFDDAISIEKLDTGFIIWVHIADVAHYVQKDTTLDLHARKLATSVYLPTKTLPMLPTHLSDNLCSLNEQLPRLSMSVEMHFSEIGEKLIDKCKFHNSVILVDKNLSYDIVNDAIDTGEGIFFEWKNYANLLQKHRKGLALETDDVRLELGGQMKLSVKSSSNSTKMIETFMVAANETIAELMEKDGYPAIYRNHPLPDQNAIERFNAQAKLVGLDANIEYPNITEEKEETETSILDMLTKGGGGNITFSLGAGSNFALPKTEEEEKENEDTPKLLIKGLAQLTEDQINQFLDPYRSIIGKIEAEADIWLQKLEYLIVLRSLSRAAYNAYNMGHFGLGSTAYLHFTSPIRRYPDVIAHRICKSILAGDELPYTSEEIEELAQHCSEQSEIAERLEKTIIGAGFSFLTRNKTYSDNKQGVVVSIFGGGVFVLLPNGIEARIPMSKLSDRPTFVDDYESMCFVGSRSDYNFNDKLTPTNWEDVLQKGDEPIEVIVKLGDRIALEFISWNHVEGKVEAAPVTIESGDFD
ncbi:MAG: ribonuclease R [Candidatus Heimdallarchaeota archaeon]|nr:ribonuclease R [Candidatus Heimdallarchaeota archaeon]MDH5644512.1 ribonuclease R [Candidatus Heimdallarchaeota archaeon]